MWWWWWRCGLQAGPQTLVTHFHCFRGSSWLPAQCGPVYTAPATHWSSGHTQPALCSWTLYSYNKMKTCGCKASSPSCSFTARQLMLRPNTILVTPTLLIRHKNPPQIWRVTRARGEEAHCSLDRILRERMVVLVVGGPGSRCRLIRWQCRGQIGKHRRLVTTLCLHTPESRLLGKIDS